MGSLGASYISHMVSDARVSPPEYASHYSEHLIYLPHTYVVNDYRQQVCVFCPREAHAPRVATSVSSMRSARNSAACK